MLSKRPTVDYRGIQIPNFATIRELSRAGVLSETALRRLHAQGQLPGIFVGNRFYANTAMLIEKLDIQSATQADRG